MKEKSHGDNQARNNYSKSIKLIKLKSNVAINTLTSVLHFLFSPNGLIQVGVENDEK